MNDTGGETPSQYAQLATTQVSSGKMVGLNVILFWAKWSKNAFIWFIRQKPLGRKPLVFGPYIFFPSFFQTSRTKLNKGKNRSVSAGASKSSSSSKQTIANDNFPPVKRKGGNKRKISWQDDYSIQVWSNVNFFVINRNLPLFFCSLCLSPIEQFASIILLRQQSSLYILSTQRSMLFLSYIYW